MWLCGYENLEINLMCPYILFFNFISSIHFVANICIFWSREQLFIIHVMIYKD